MKNLFIKEEYKSPEVTFDAEKGILELKGKAVPERTEDFFNPLLEWIDNYIQSPSSETTFNLKLEYCNSSSTRYILDMLEKLQSLYQSGHKVTANWYYEEDDESMLDLGESYKEPLDLPLNLISVPVDDL
ncbi:MAG: DUF1987 domain-containing protein [Bacteroidota bacterium]